MKMEGKVHGEFDLPGFRFHPTEEELVAFYLKKKVEGQQFCFDIIGTLDLYRYDPWQLPGLALIGGREWFFFVPRDKKCTAPRRSRLTVSGYWKATGSDKAIRNQIFQSIGLKKTLVFYRGKAPRGVKTDWIMNEYRVPEGYPSIKKKDVVLCRIYRKATTQKTLEKRAIGEREGFLNISAKEKLPRKCEVPLLNYESESMDEGLSCVNRCEDDDFLDCMNAIMDSKIKPPELELEIPRMCVDKLFSQQGMVSPWTPSILLSTPKDYWNNNSDNTCMNPPVNTVSPCKVGMPLWFL